MTLYAVRWTRSDGTPAEWHFARRDVAEEHAVSLRSGWRKDARVVKLDAADHA